MCLHPLYTSAINIDYWRMNIIAVSAHHSNQEDGQRDGTSS